MRIEISAGGISGGIAVSQFQSGMKNYIKKTGDVISSFTTVKNKTYNLNGGVGNLQDALDGISARVHTEEARERAAERVQKKANDFLDLAVRVDKEVATLVNKNKEEFYRTNPWLKPSWTQDAKKFFSDAWKWLCGVRDTLVKGASAIWEGIKNTVKKAWDNIVTFYQEHKQIIDTILIVVGAIAAIAAVIATGGLALAPLIGGCLTALGISAATAAAIAEVVSVIVAVTAVVSTIGASTFNVIDIWWDKSDDPEFQTWKKVFNVVSIVTNTLYSIGNLYNSFTGVDGKEYIARQRAIKNGKMGYGNLDGSNSRIKIGDGRDYSPTQKRMIREENMRRNNGVLRDDLTGKKAVVYDPRSGLPKPPNAVEIDHIIPKSGGGQNSFSNARLINWKTNLIKRDNPNFSLDFVIDEIPEIPKIGQGFMYGIFGNFQSLLYVFRK